MAKKQGEPTGAGGVWRPWQRSKEDIRGQGRRIRLLGEHEGRGGICGQRGHMGPVVRDHTGAGEAGGHTGAAEGGEMTISNKRKTTPNKATTSYVDALSYGT